MLLGLGEGGVGGRGGDVLVPLGTSWYVLFVKILVHAQDSEASKLRFSCCFHVWLKMKVGEHEAYLFSRGPF